MRNLFKLNARPLAFVFPFKSMRNLTQLWWVSTFSHFAFPLLAAFMKRGDKGEKGAETENVAEKLLAQRKVFTCGYISYTFVLQ